jgi:hypothetical protein
MLPRPGQLAARIGVVKKFLQVLWFCAPVLLLMACVTAALFALLEFRVAHLLFPSISRGP